MHQLNEVTKALLATLLAETPSSDAGVDTLSFRANNYGDIETIDWLESAGYIRREGERYFVSLTALVQMSEEQAERLVKNSTALFAELQHYYRRTQRKSVDVEELASDVGLTPTEAKEALSYMVEGPWWGGRSTSFFETPDPTVCPSEAILGYETFNDVIAQLRLWQASRIRDRQLSLAAAPRDFPLNVPASKPHSVRHERQPPDWTNQLPSQARNLLLEIYSAKTSGLSALPAMGTRAIIDVVFVDLIGDIGTFTEKLSLLVSKGHLSERERPLFAAAIEAGNASAHRGYVPNVEDLEALLDIVERLLHGHYVLPPAAQKIHANTPSRPKRINR